MLDLKFVAKGEDGSVRSVALDEKMMGLFRTAAKVGVASAVRGRVQRRQQQREKQKVLHG